MDTAFKQDVSAALIRMLTSNMLTIVKDDFKQRSSLRDKPSPCALSKELLGAFVGFLEAYEDTEEVAEGVYEVLQAFVQISQATKRASQREHLALVRMLDGAKDLLAMAVKHASSYGCAKAYDFLSDYTKASEKYANNRQAIEQALQKLKT